MGKDTERPHPCPQGPTGEDRWLPPSLQTSLPLFSSNPLRIRYAPSHGLGANIQFNITNYYQVPTYA